MKCTKPVYLNEHPVPCGKCYNCQVLYKMEWGNRCDCELETSKTGVFITLTYDEEHMRAFRDVSRDVIQKFFKSFRQELGLYQKQKIKYYAIGDYGDVNGRPHYHVAIFGVGKRSPIFKYIDYERGFTEINAWKNGYVHVQILTPGRIRYVTGYLMKKYTHSGEAQMYGGRPRPFAIMSKGIGKSYAQINQEELIKNKSVRRSGADQTLPRYFRKLLEMKDPDISEKLKKRVDCMALAERALLATFINGTTSLDEAQVKYNTYKHKQNLQIERNHRGRMGLK